MNRGDLCELRAEKSWAHVYDEDGFVMKPVIKEGHKLIFVEPENFGSIRMGKFLVLPLCLVGYIKMEDIRETW